MCGTAGEQRASTFGAKQAPAKQGCRAERGNPEPGQQQWTKWEMRRPEDLVEQLARMVEERADEPPVRGVVATERAGGRIDGLGEDDRRFGVHGMRDRRGWLDPVEAVLRKRKRREERREDAERMCGGADVVVESGQRELGGPRSAADGLGSLEHLYRRPVARELDSGREPIGATPDHYRVEPCRHVDPYAAGVAATTSPLASTIPSSHTASTLPPWNCCS